MGTGQPGRSLNTRGSSHKVSDFAMVHSIEGLFTQPRRRDEVLRLKSGGHGQKGMDLLDRYGIEYNVVRTYSNGVRVGNVPNHKNRLKRTGSNQYWFPKSWTAKDIRRAGEHVTGLKKNKNSPDGVAVFGVYEGVRVGVIRTNGKIATIFPDHNQNSVLRRRKKK